MDALEAFDALPQIAFSPYPPDTMKALDSMILSKLRLLQDGLSFQEAKFLVVKLGDAGFGVSVPGLLSTQLVLGYLHDRTVMVDEAELLYDFCYEPVSSHHFEEIPREHTDRKVILQSARALQDLHSSKVVYAHLKPRVNIESPLNPVSPLSVPLRNLYARGLVLGSFLKLKQKYGTYIEEKRKEIGLKSPVIGVHVRQGGVSSDPDWDRHFPFQIYLEAVKHVVNITGINTVFVVTDSEEVIRQLPRNAGIDFIYDDKEKRCDTIMAEMLHDYPELREQETLTAVKNIYLLADCDYILSCIGSWFYNSVAMSYFRKKKCNGICLYKRGESGCDIRYLITGNNADDTGGHQGSPVSPSTDNTQSVQQL